MLFRKYAAGGGAALVFGALFLLWLWQPERQVRLHTSHFLKKVERRNWAGAGKMMADDYADRWQHDKEAALANAEDAFRQFLFVTIENRSESAGTTPDRAATRTFIKISGSGGPLAQLVMERVNTLREPFVFTWRQGSAKPWDWKLISVDHPELNTERLREF